MEEDSFTKRFFFKPFLHIHSVGVNTTQLGFSNTDYLLTIDHNVYFLVSYSIPCYIVSWT